MKSPLLLPAALVIVVWVLSFFLSFQKSVPLGDWGWVRVTSAWGSTALSGRKYSPTDYKLVGPSNLREGITRYQSAYQFDNGRPIRSEIPKLSISLKGFATLRRDDPNSFFVSVPYWMLSLGAMTPALFWLFQRKGHHDGGQGDFENVLIED